MGVAEADALQDILERAKMWPVWNADPLGGVFTPAVFSQGGQYGQSLRDIALWAALRESDRPRIQQEIKWDGDREYRVDPLPLRIAEAYSDLLFGEDPEFRVPGSQSDQENFDKIVRDNDLPSELRRWCTDCVSEGEIWWRIYVDTEVSDSPIVEASSRLDVIPYFLGRRIGAAAFIETLFSQDVTIENTQKTVYFRHIEIQTDGLVRHALYRGEWSSLGDRVPLSQFPETERLEEEWNHGLPIMLAGRIPNKLGRDWRLGVSDYQGIKDLILDLNESRTIMAENARNTAKARMIVPASALDEDGKFRAGDDVIVAESLDDSLDDKKGPYAVLEYTFQAGPLLQHIDNLMLTALTRVGLAEQFVGGGRSSSEGQAFTGTALRTRLIPTTLAASGKGRFWDSELPRMAKALALVSNLPPENGGLGVEWSNVEDDFVVNRSTVLPEDLNEETQRHVIAVQGEIESIDNAVREMHTDWDEDKVKEEIDRIKESGPQAPPPPNLPPGMEGDPGNPQPGADRTQGTRQPGAGRGVDGQSPGKQPPEVVAGGPR